MDETSFDDFEEINDASSFLDELRSYVEKISALVTKSYSKQSKHGKI